MPEWRKYLRGNAALCGLKRFSASRPGVLCEAFFWTLGFLVAQGLILVVLLAVMLTASFGISWPGQSEILNWVLETDLDRSFLLIATPVLGAIFLILPAIRLREGREFRQKIGWRIPTSEEIVYSLATVVPVAIIGNLVYDVVNHWWLSEPILWPFALALRESSLDQIYRSFQGVPYPALVIAMALAPAMVEELVFRGMLGRRLVQRLGVVWGVVIASICFAAVHGSLPHAIATLPIAILLHVLYLQTGTIWIPVFVHFCNNLLAISLVRFNLGPENAVSLPFLLALCCYLILMLVLLQIRPRQWTAIGRETMKMV